MMQQKNICKFYIVRKNRLCKFQAMKNSYYCHAHCSDLETQVQCPYQKGMFIKVQNLQKHLQNCPKVRDNNKQKMNEWYNKNINKIQKQIKIDKIQTLSTINNKKIQQVYNKILKIYQKYFNFQIDFIRSQEINLINKSNDHFQAEMIVKEMQNYKLLSKDYIYVEFGAGKGILSYTIANKIKQITNQNSKNILLQRQVRRNKFDKFFKNNQYFQRYKSDVTNFDFQMLPIVMAKYAANKLNIPYDEQISKELSKCKIIGVCKHMCGQGLDISIQGILNCKPQGLVLASCCHHLCNYDSYINPQFFENEGFNPNQIQLMFRISSWGTKNILIKEQNIQNLNSLSKKNPKHLEIEEKTLVGRMAKRLIDLGRAKKLNAVLKKYCSDQITPQNYLIISHK